MVEDVVLGFAFDDELPFPLQSQLFEEGLPDSNALAIVERWIIDDGMYGGKEVNATIVKLLLQNNHGMREKQDIGIEGDLQITVNLVRHADA